MMQLDFKIKTINKKPLLIKGIFAKFKPSVFDAFKFKAFKFKLFKFKVFNLKKTAQCFYQLKVFLSPFKPNTLKALLLSYQKYAQEFTTTLTKAKLGSKHPISQILWLNCLSSLSTKHFIFKRLNSSSFLFLSIKAGKIQIPQIFSFLNSQPLVNLAKKNSKGVNVGK